MNWEINYLFLLNFLQSGVFCLKYKKGIRLEIFNIGVYN